MALSLKTLFSPGPAAGREEDNAEFDEPTTQVKMSRQQTGYDPAMDTAKGAGVGAAIGALGGAAAGAAIGAATGSAGTGAAIGAATGAVGGAAVGGGYKYSKSKEGYEQGYATCMSHKGYQVR